MNRHHILRFAFRLACALSIAGCDDAGGAPDSGFGASQPVPASRSCADFCGRFGSCFAALCDEDTMSKKYDDLGDLFKGQCLGTCSQNILTSTFSASQWQCYFQSSCRQVFGADACHQNAHYSCH